MKNIYIFLIASFILISNAMLAQPSYGTTDFAYCANATLAISGTCTTPKTGTIAGWAFEVSTTGTCGIQLVSNCSTFDGHINLITSGGNWLYGKILSNNGDDFKFQSISIGSQSTGTVGGWVNNNAVFVGYQNGSPVSGATLTAPSFTGGGLNNPNIISVTGFTNNAAFNSVDEIRIFPANTCSTTLSILDITISNTVTPCVTPTLSLTGQTNVLCNGGSTGSATMSASGNSGFTYTWSPSGGNAASATGLGAGTYTCITANSCSLTDQQTVTISQPASAPGGVLSFQPELCNGGNTGSATVTASGGTAPYTYTWSVGGTASVIATQTFGVKTVTITDANNCTSIRQNTITQPSAISTATGYTNVFCNGGANGSATIIVVSGGVAPYTYSWSTGATGTVITGLIAGSYTVRATDANGCSTGNATRTITISQPSAAVSINTATRSPLCNGNNGSATVTASGGTGAYSYTWSSGPTTSVEPTLLAGTYTVKVTDANSCSLTSSVTIGQPGAISTSTGYTNVLCNGNSTGSATMVVTSGGTPPFTYTWSTGATGTVITSLSAATYSTRATDANGCSSSTRSIVISQPLALTNTIAVTNIACNGGSNGSATITASGGTTPYSYLWSNGATLTPISGLVSGAYTATVTDANSCTSVTSASISQPALALATSTAVTNIACNGGSTGSATITASGGISPYTYLWSNGATLTAISNVLSGAYTATVTDANSCTSVTSAGISQPASALATSTAVTNIACNGGSTGSATITASGGISPYTYLWSNGATLTAVSGLVSGAYTATVTDANSCTSIKSFSISQPPALTLTAVAASASVCSGGSTTLTANGTGGTGTILYNWTAGPTTNTYVVSPSALTVYTVNATDANSCTKTATVSVGITSNPVISVNSPTICSGTSAVITPSGATSYTITGNTFTVSPGATASYTVTGAVGSCPASNTVVSTVSVNASPTVVVASNGTICSGTAFSIAATGAPTLAITGGTFNVSPTANTSYTVTGTEVNGCTGTVVATVSVNTTPTVVASSGTICSGTAYSIVATGAPTLAITGATFNVSPTANTSYTVTGTNPGNCTRTVVATVSVNTTPTVVASSGTICSGTAYSITATGATTLAITGGTFNVSPTANASYTVTGTNPGNCTNSVVATVSVNTTPTVAASNGTICSGTSYSIVATGAPTLAITGGTFNVSPTANTSYTVTGTNPGNCTNSVVATISVNITPTVAASSGTICSGAAYSITATGAPTLAITGGTFNVSPTANASYTVTGTNPGNCSNSVVATVSVNTTPTVVASSGTICSGAAYSIAATGAPTLAITGGTFNVSPTANASYTVTGTNPGNCTNSVVATVSVNTTPTVVASSGTICSGTSYSIVASGAPVLAITGGTFNVSPTANASYTVTGTNPGNCTGTVVATVSVNATPTVVVSSGSICSGNAYSISATGAPVLAITGGTFNVAPAATTAYTVTGTNPGNCTATAVANVTVSATPTVVVPSYTNCTAGAATIVPAGAGAGGSYSITPGTSFTVNPAVTTNYSVTATSSANCVSGAVVSTVTVLQSVTLSVLSNTTICAGNSVVITPTGASTYTITGGTFTVSPTTTTSYSITGFVGSCASLTQAVITVSVNANPTVSATSGTICSGTAYSIVAAGTTGASLTVNGGTFNVSPLTTTAYTVTATSANNCIATAISNVTVAATPTLVVSSGSICSGNSYSVVATGAPALTITGGTFNVAPATNTTYVITGTAAVSGCTASAVANVSVTATPTLVVPDYTVCLGKSATITPTGATYYMINGFTGGTYVATPTANASYTTNGITVNGCPSANTATSNVTVIANPTVVASSGIACSATGYSIVATGAPTLNITGGNFSVTPLVNTNYTITGTAVNGCTAIAVSNITASPSPTITVPNYSVCLGKTVTVTGSGAGTGGTYTINAVAGNGYSNTPSASTTYTVAGTSSVGCVSANTATTAVTVFTLPVITLPATNTTICSGGTVNIVAAGAGVGGTYTITPGTSFNPTPITNTTYSVTGTQNGCVSSNTAVVTVSVNASPTIVVNSGGVCLNSTYTITPTGANTYTMNTSGTFTAAGTNFLINPIVTTTYSVTGTGTNNCLSTVTGVATITISPLPVVTINSGDICPNNSFAFVATGANTYTYTGSTGTVSATFTPSASDVYSVTGTSALGCISSNVATSTVNVVNTVTVSVFGNMDICTGQNTDLTANGATTYTWSNSATTNSVNVSPTANTTYTVTGNTGNCTNTAVVTVTVHALPVVTVTGASICKGKTYTITPTGADTYTYSTGSAVITPTGNVTYSVTGTSTAGCVSANPAVATLTVNALPNITVSNSVICVGESATLTAAGGTAYAWNTGGTGASIVVTPTVNTTYTVTGTDANGCSKAVFVTQVTDLCLGIAKQTSGINYSLYPNPNNGEFVITVDQPATLTVLNNLGQVVYSANVTEGKAEIDLKQQSNGFYFVNINQGNTAKTVKVIKQ